MLKVKGQAEGIRVNNGDIYPVEGYTKEGDIRLPGGKILPKDYGHFTLGYTDTSHRSQAKTVDRVFIAVDEHAPKATNRTQWYVSWSRGRDAGLAVVADKKERDGDGEARRRAALGAGADEGRHRRRESDETAALRPSAISWSATASGGS